MSRQQRRSEETRSRILEAAARSFGRHGYEAASVDEICQAAGMSKGALYHHFRSKHEIFLELLNRWLGGLGSQMTLLRNEGESVPEALQSMGQLAASVFEAAEDRFPLFLEFWSRAARDAEIWKATIAPYHGYRDFFAGMVQAGVDEGTLQPSDPSTSARIILSLAMGMILQAMLDPKGADWQHVTHEGIRVLLEGLEKR